MTEEQEEELEAYFNYYSLQEFYDINDEELRAEWDTILWVFKKVVAIIGYEFTFVGIGEKNGVEYPFYRLEKIRKEAIEDNEEG